MRLIANGSRATNEVRVTVLAAGSLLLLASAAAQGAYALTRSWVPNGGGRSTGGQYALQGAIGDCTTIKVFSGSGAPAPDPMQWATVPHAISSASIAMTAVEAQDPNGTVQYYFQNVTIADGSHDSGWQEQRSYTDTGLSPDTVYEYRVKARGGGGLGSETEHSAPCFARTEPTASQDRPEGSAEPVSGELGSDLNLQVDPFTGSVSYTMPIALPPGRQGSEPSLSLRYGAGGNGWCGVGWSLGLGAIQRDTRRGVPVARDPNGQFINEYDDDKGFVAAFGAVNSRLVEVNDVTSEYRAETDQAFLKYEFDRTNNRWIVTDKSGNKFYFGAVAGENQGETAGATMVHPQFDSATDSDNTFLWALAKIQDISGNLTYAYYTEDANQFYLDEVRYNGHTQGLPTTSSVRFVLDPNDRSDQSVSYATGYRVENNRRLNDIAVWVYDYDVTDWTRVRRYHLDYEQSPSTLRSLLTSVTLYGTSDANSLPPVTFDYQVKPFEFEPTVDWGPLNSQSASASWNSPIATDVRHWAWLLALPGYPDWQDISYYLDGTYVSLCDVDGDGLPDRVLRNASGFQGPDNNALKVQLNTGSGFGPLRRWGPIDAQGHATDNEASFWNSPRATWLGVATGWLSCLPRWNPVTQEFEDYWECTYDLGGDTCVTLVDIDGDGLADRVMRNDVGNYAAPNNVFKVQLNNGTGFNSSGNWGPLDGCGHVVSLGLDERARMFNSIEATWHLQGGSPSVACLVDMNRDGLPDRVLYEPEQMEASKQYHVQFNTGEGFEMDNGSPVAANWGPVDSQGSAHYLWRCPRSVDRDEEAVIDLVDINGDGLPDRVMRRRTSPYNVFRVQFNTGYGFEQDEESDAIVRDWGPVDGQGDTSIPWNTLQAVITDSGTLHVDFFDINGDGLSDRVMRERTGNEGGDPGEYDVLKVQLNTGVGFQTDATGAAVLVDWTGVDDQGAGTPDWASPHGLFHPQHQDTQVD